MPVHLNASLHLSGGRKVPAVISDLSSDGCKISIRQMLEVGEIVELIVPGRDSFRARIRWATVKCAGLLFI
ncbi:MAG: PilZ domain-containing protein [Sphingomicrobium sp.]